MRIALHRKVIAEVQQKQAIPVRTSKIFYIFKALPVTN